MRPWLFLFGSFLSLFTEAQKSKNLISEKWQCEVKIQDKTIGFELEKLNSKSGVDHYILWNGRERIALNHNKKEGDSLICPISVFESRLIFPVKKGVNFSGFYINAKNQRMPFEARKSPLKNVEAAPLSQFAGNWKMYFHEGGLPTDSGILITEIKNGKIYGTILNETGDYRFLNGSGTGLSSFFLQTLDGGHSYRFDFELQKDSLTGTFIYGPKGIDLFYGYKTRETNVKNGFEISKVGEGKRFSFKAKDENGNLIDQTFPLIKNKGLVLQILGTWCPNCLDETKFLTEAYAQKPENVEFIGLAFERKPDLKQAFQRINILKSRLKVPYPIFFGGPSSKDSARASVPFLDKVFAFPTTVFIKADGSIYKVHSGFSGPATGKLYDAWKNEFSLLLKEINPGKK